MNNPSLSPMGSARASPSRTGRISLVLPGLQAGGSEHVVSFIADRLVERGHFAEIVSFETGEEPPYYTPDPRVELVYLAQPVARLAKLDAIRKIAVRLRGLRRHFQDSQPDLIISFLTRTNVQTVLATRGLSIPVIVSERNNPILQDPGPVWRWLRERTYPAAYGLVTMTREAMECFPPRMRRRAWVIPNMAEWGTRQRSRKSGPRKQLTAVGRLTHQKGFDLLLQAFARVSNDHPDWDLCIWGEGPDRQQLEQLRDKLGLGSRAQMPGLTDEPGKWVCEADAFVLSSRFEGWGLALGEAMAAGLPSISFACNFGPAEMIEDGVDGLLVADGNVEELAAKLDRLMGDSALRDRLGAEARKTSQRFQPAAIGAMWTDLIEDILGTVSTSASSDTAR